MTYFFIWLDSSWIDEHAKKQPSCTVCKDCYESQEYIELLEDELEMYGCEYYQCDEYIEEENANLECDICK